MKVASRRRKYHVILYSVNGQNKSRLKNGGTMNFTEYKARTVGYLWGSGQGTPGASKIRSCSISYTEWIAYDYLFYYSLNYIWV